MQTRSDSLPRTHTAAFQDIISKDIQAITEASCLVILYDPDARESAY